MRATAPIGAILLAALLAGGCGGKQRIRTPEGTATVERKGARVTVESEQGKVQLDQDAATFTSEDGGTTVKIGQAASGKDAEDMGMPVYPGAKVQHSASSVSGGENIRQVTLTTGDTVDKVKAYYQKQLPKLRVDLDGVMPDGHIVSMSLKEGGVTRTIQISRTRRDKETTVVLNRAEGEK